MKFLKRLKKKIKRMYKQFIRGELKEFKRELKLK